MGLREIVTRSIQMFKDEFDLDQELGSSTLAAQHVQLKQDMTDLRRLLEETQDALKEKDELIAALQAGDVMKEEMILDGSAYFVTRDQGIIDGPFCASCFDQRQERVYLVPASKPRGSTGHRSEWVQCLQCRTPFRSRRVGEFLRSKEPVSATPKSKAESTVKSKTKPKPKPKPKAKAETSPKRPARSRRQSSR